MGLLTKSRGRTWIHSLGSIIFNSRRGRGGEERMSQIRQTSRSFVCCVCLCVCLTIYKCFFSCNKIQDQGQKAELHNAVTGILKTAKLPPSNISKEEEKAIKGLKTDKTITILPADKGRTTVVMDTETYTNQMEQMLGDSTTY